MIGIQANMRVTFNRLQISCPQLSETASLKGISEHALVTMALNQERIIIEREQEQEDGNRKKQSKNKKARANAVPDPFQVGELG
ncbi:hypothetical protein [Pajaroellobacter abortibovis]|uniref:hypothetical protein n=1 Tax=Pajaroellobacter abortibovis TaxID=1882918 RepID=UPI0009F9ADC3|nr:hypothetical protein [Pajaroellobacter abortibovis]